MSVDDSKCNIWSDNECGCSWIECDEWCFCCLNFDSFDSSARSFFYYFSDFSCYGRILSSNITCKSVNSPYDYLFGNSFSLSCYVCSICVFCLLFLSSILLLFLLELRCLNEISSLLRLIGVYRVCLDFLWYSGDSSSTREELILFFLARDFSLLAEESFSLFFFSISFLMISLFC